MNREATLTTVEDLLAEARAEIDRLSPAEAHAAAQAGDVLVDIRPLEQRRRDGLVPGAAIVERNVAWTSTPATSSTASKAGWQRACPSTPPPPERSHPGKLPSMRL